MTTLVDLLEPLAACGFLRQVTRLCVVSKELKLAAPMGTGRQVHEAVRDGNVGALTSYLAWWRGNRESHEVLNWESDLTGFGSTPLLAAVTFARVECVQLLADESPAVDVNKGYISPLNLASEKGNAAIVGILLAVKGIKVNKTCRQDGNTSLHSAARYNNPEVVRLLVAAKGIELEQENGEYETPLAIALRLEHDEVAAIILSAIEARKVLDAAGEALYDAADENEVVTLRLLLEKWSGDEYVLNWHNPDQHMETRGRSYTPLLTACHHGHIQAVRLLASTPGVDVNETDDVGFTPLIESSYFGHIEVVRFLLTECPAVDVNKETNVGRDAFMMAVEGGFKEIVDLLLADKRLRNVNKVSTSSGCTALMWAARYGRVEVVRSLLAYEGIDVNVEGTRGQYNGSNALIMAAEEGHEEIVNLLLADKRLRNVNKVSTSSGCAALMWAARYGRVEVVRSLLAYEGIDVNVEGTRGYYRGQSALSFAISSGNSEIAALLRAAGATEPPISDSSELDANSELGSNSDLDSDPDIDSDSD